MQRRPQPSDDREAPARGARPAVRRAPGEAEVEPRGGLQHRAWRLVLYALFVAGSVAALVGERGLLDLLRLQGEYRQAHVDLAEQQAKVEAQRRIIERLRSDPLARERIARERLGLARPGEFVFLLPHEDESAPDDDDDTAPAPARPRPDEDDAAGEPPR